MLIEQIKLFFVKPNGRRYSGKTYLMAYTIYMKSSYAYDALRKFFALPHTSLLKSMVSKIAQSCESLDVNKKYLTTYYAKLKEHERVISLYADEIQISEKIEFKDGKIYGFSENRPETTAHHVQASCFHH